MPKPPRSRPAPTAADERDGGLRLQKFLAMAGLGSRRHCEEFISTGRVTVDRQVVTELGAKVDPRTQEVRLDGERVKAESRVYFLVNKPPGVLCTNQDPAGRPRVIDLFPRLRERLFTVGRLDEHSQGLLVVTNDGELANLLAHPRFGVAKTYRVQVAGVPTREILETLEEGLHFAEGRFRVSRARLIKAGVNSSVIEIVLNEGQNREIRRLLARAGHKVLRLARVALGPLKIGALPLGAIRPLTSREVRDLQHAAEARPARRGKSRSSKSARRDRPPAAAASPAPSAEASTAPRTRTRGSANRDRPTPPAGEPRKQRGRNRSSEGGSRRRS